MNNLKNTLAALLIFSFTVMGVHAEDPVKSFRKKGKFGIGANPILGFSSSSGENGSSQFSSRAFQLGVLPTVRLFVTNSISFDVNLGLAVTNKLRENNTTETKINDVSTIIRVGAFKSYKLAYWQRSQLDVALGVNVTSIRTKSEYTSTNKQTGISAPTGEDESSSLAIQLGIRPEWFVNENLSFHTQVGIVFSILSEDNSGFSEGGINVNIFGTSDLLGASGFTFYF